MSKSFPLIEVSGSPRARGQQYGRQAGERIALGLQLYRAEFARRGVDWPKVLELAESFSEKIAAYGSDFIEEMQGIAAGAEQEFAAIVILNARTEILYWYGAQHGQAADQGPAMSDECTGILVTPAASADGEPIHAQNWDWRTDCVDTAVVLKISGGPGPDILTLAEAGQLARSGLNSDGIALTAMGLHCDQDYGKLGIPSPLIRRRLLQQRTLAGALDIVVHSERSFSHNLMLSDASGLAVDLETTPEDVFWLQPQRGLLYHTNHFKSPAALARVRDIGLIRGIDTLIRDQRVGLILEPHVGAITVDHVRSALADDAGHPLGVCRHPVKREEDGFSCTVATVIMNPRQRTLSVAAAPYEGAQFVHHTF